MIEDWKQAYKWYSMHAAAILTVLSALQASLPQVQAFLPPTTFAITTGVLGVLVVIGRVVNQ